MNHLHQGLYDLLETDDLHQQLDKTLLDACFENISEASLPDRLANALAERLIRALGEIKASKSSNKAAEQVACVNGLLSALRQPALRDDST